MKILHISPNEVSRAKKFNQFKDGLKEFGLDFKEQQFILDLDGEIHYFRTMDEEDKIRGMKFNEVFIDEFVTDKISSS